MQLDSSWDVEEQSKRAIFMDHMYQCSGRSDVNHPMHGLFTNLWQEFCLYEAGKAMRDQWFHRMQFVKDLEDGKIQQNPDGPFSYV